MANNDRPRLDFLSDSDYFMAVALLAETMSKEPKKGGACIVKDNNVVAVGFNQMIECRDDDLRQYCEHHAEIDAIINCTDVKGCTMYVTAYPCNECLKLIIQKGIRAVVYLRKDNDAKPNKARAAAKMISEADIQCKIFNDQRPTQREDLQIEFKKEDPPEGTQSLERSSKRRKLEATKLVHGHTQKPDSDITDFFMGLALLTAMRGVDPKTQVGACIVRDNNKVIGCGHNLMPEGKNNEYPWARDGEDTKYLYVCHAELNAIVNSTDVKGCTIYVTRFPCDECAKLLIKAGIEEVVYLSDFRADMAETKASKQMLEANKIPYVSFYKREDPQREPIVIKFE